MDEHSTQSGGSDEKTPTHFSPTKPPTHFSPIKPPTHFSSENLPEQHSSKNYPPRNPSITQSVGILNNYQHGKPRMADIVETMSSDDVNIYHNSSSQTTLPENKLSHDRNSSIPCRSLKMGNSENSSKSRKRSGAVWESDIVNSILTDNGTKVEDIKPSRIDAPAGPIKSTPNFFMSFHEYVLAVSHSKGFNRFMMVTIIVNAIIIALESELSQNKVREAFFSFNEVFTACYTFEFFLKFYSDRTRYWMSAYNLFDFCILIVAYVDLALEILNYGSNVSILTSLKSLRAFRALKIVSFIKGVQVIAGAIASTLKQLVRDVILLLFLLMFVFGVMGFYFFGYESESAETDDEWGSLSAVFLSLFTVVTADRWSKFIDSLIESGNSIFLSRAYIILFLFVGHFIIANLFVAVIITNIQGSSDDFKAKMLLEREIQVNARKKQYWIRCRKEVKRMMLRAHLDGKSNFQEIATEFYYTLRKHDFVIMSDLKTNFLWLDSSLKELNRYSKSYRQMNRLHHQLIKDISPMCSFLEVDDRKSSISTQRRYILKQRLGGLQLLSAVQGEHTLHRRSMMHR